jgi:hypothetical protein
METLLQDLNVIHERDGELEYTENEAVYEYIPVLIAHSLYRHDRVLLKNTIRKSYDEVLQSYADFKTRTNDSPLNPNLLMDKKPFFDVEKWYKIFHGLLFETNHILAEEGDGEFFFNHIISYLDTPFVYSRKDIILTLKKLVCEKSVSVPESVELEKILTAAENQEKPF